MTTPRDVQYDYFGNPIGPSVGIATLYGGSPDRYLDELRGRVANNERLMRELRTADLQARVNPTLRGGSFRGGVSGGSGMPYSVLTGGPANPPPGGGGSTPPGWNDEVGYSLGNILPAAGSVNLLLDPTFENMGNLSAALGTSRARIVNSWYGYYTLNSGSGSAAFLYPQPTRIEYPAENPLNSTMLKVNGVSGTTASDTSVYLDQEFPMYAGMLPQVPYIVAAVKVYRWSYDPAKQTKALVTIELYNDDTAAVAASTTFDLLTMQDNTLRTVWCSILQPATKYHYTWRVRVDVAKPSTTPSYTPHVYIGEPQLHFSYTPDPIPFGPAIAGWQPDRLIAYDPSYGPDQLTVLDKYGLAFGPGTTAIDTIIERAGTRILRVRGSSDAVNVVTFDFSSDDNPWVRLRRDSSNGEAGFEVFRGTESYSRIRMMSEYFGEPNITLGDGANPHDARLKRTGTKTLTIDDAADTANAVTVNVKGELQDDGVPLRQVGWQPYCYMPGFSGSGTYTTALSIAANGGCIAIPIVLDGKMSLRQVSVWNTDAATQRSWNWALYAQLTTNGSNTLDRVAYGSAADTFTPGAASKRTIAATSAPVFLPEGVYWLVIQSVHATSSFGLGSVASGTLSHNRAQTKTVTNPVGATLDFVAATWTKVSAIYAAVLEGDVFGQAAAF